MKNKIEDLRNHLFATLEGLADKENPLDLERARAIADVGRVIVDSAKAEVQFLQVVERMGPGAPQGTGFITISTGESGPERPRLAGGMR